MLKLLLKNSIIYTISDFIGKIISFFLIPVYTQLLTPEDYGIIDLFAVLASISLMMVSFQINQGMARYYHELKHNILIKIYASTTLAFALITFSLFSALSIVFVDLINDSVFNSKLSYNTLYILIAFIFLKGIYYIASSHLKWKGQATKESICNVTNTLIGICFSFVFIVIENEGVYGFFKGQLIGCFIALILSLIFSRKDYGNYFSFKILKKLLSFGAPLILSAISVFFILYTDRIMIKYYLGFDELGVYGIGVRIASLISFFVVGLNAALSPLIYFHYKTSKMAKELSYVFKIFNLALIISIVFLSIFSKEILELLTTSKYFGAEYLIPILSISILVQSWNNFSPGLSIAKKTKLITKISVLAGGVNFVLNLFLIPSIGLIGATISTLFSYLINFYLLNYFGQKEYKIELFSFKFGLLTVSGIVAYFLVLLLSNYSFSNIASLKAVVFITFLSFSLILFKIEIVDVIKKIKTKFL